MGFCAAVAAEALCPCDDELRCSKNDLTGAIAADGEASAEATRIRDVLQGDRQRLTELQSEQAAQVPATNSPQDQQAPSVQGETQLPNVEDNPGTREEDEPVLLVNLRPK